MTAVLLLSPKVRKATKEYFQQTINHAIITSRFHHLGRTPRNIRQLRHRPLVRGLMFAIGPAGLQWWRMFKRGCPGALDGHTAHICGRGYFVGSRLGHVFFYQWGLLQRPSLEDTAMGRRPCQPRRCHRHNYGRNTILDIQQKRNPLWTFDRLTVAIALVGCPIRIGNLMNSEIFGYQPTCRGASSSFISVEWQREFAPQACHPHADL